MPTYEYTVGYGRKITDGNYGSTDASAYSKVIFTDADEGAPEDAAELLGVQFVDVKARVLQELGIPFAFDSEGVIRENQSSWEALVQAFDGTTDASVDSYAQPVAVPTPTPEAATGGPGPQPKAVDPVPDVAGRDVSVPPPSTPPAPPAASQGEQQPSQTCPEDPAHGMWNNTSGNDWRRRNGYRLGPEFKCKNKSCGKVLWPADFEQYKDLPRAPVRSQ